jgi:hypothetical protein
MRMLDETDGPAEGSKFELTIGLFFLFLTIYFVIFLKE